MGAVSFKNTHVVKRMGLLTIILLGEGVLNTARELSDTALHAGWTAEAFGQALVAVLVIYMIWDLYFGKIPNKHFGTFRQQLYTILHYPFHLSLATSPSTKVAQLNTTFHSILPSIRYKDFFPVEEIEAAFNETYTAILERNTTALSSSLDSVITLIYNGLLADEGIQISDK